MSAIAFIAVAAIATLLRAVVTTEPAAAAIPWRTLLVNVVGAFVLGLLLGANPLDASIVVTVAGLGSLTTFSTVVAEAAALLDDGHKRHAILYLGLTLVFGIAAARLGLEIGVSQ